MTLAKNLPIPIKILSKNPLMDFPTKNSMDPNPPDFQPISIFAYPVSDMTGGYVCFYLACYSYMADISDTKSRTKRLSLLDGLFPLGFYIGNASSGYIKKNLGFMYNFSLGMLFAMLAMGYTCLFVKDSRHIR